MKTTAQHNIGERHSTHRERIGLLGFVIREQASLKHKEALVPAELALLLEPSLHAWRGIIVVDDDTQCGCLVGAALQLAFALGTHSQTP